MWSVGEIVAPCSSHGSDPPVSLSLPLPLSDLQPFHIFHKVPAGDGPYVKAKHAQLVERNPEKAISLFRVAIEAGDRVDSALKDMAIVMKQQNRSEEAIQAIASLRDRCSEQAQESLDNVLLDLFKSSGRVDEQIVLITRKLNLFHQGVAFNGRRTKTARSQGKKFQVSLEQEATRLLGNLGWAYMQKFNYIAAEAVYRKALSIEIDNNKVCNLGICLMKQGRLEEARAVLRSVRAVVADKKGNSESHMKSYERAQELLQELQASLNRSRTSSIPGRSKLDAPPQEFDSWPYWKLWQPPSSSSDQAASQSASSDELDQCWQSSGQRLQQQQSQQPSSEWGCRDGQSLSIGEHIEKRATAEEISGMVAAAAAAVAVATAATAGRERDDVALMLSSEQEGEDDMMLVRDAKDNGSAKGTGRSSPASSSLISPMQLRALIGISNRRRLPVFQDLTILGSA